MFTDWFVESLSTLLTLYTLALDEEPRVEAVYNYIEV